jgi:uncharacterized membrane protein YkoI
MRLFIKIALLFLLPFVVMTHRAEAQYSSSSCLPKYDTNQMVREKKIVSPAPLIKDAKSRYKGDVVNVELCPEGEHFIFFYVVILEPSGKVRFVAYNAKDGSFYKVL